MEASLSYTSKIKSGEDEISDSYLYLLINSENQFDMTFVITTY